MTLTILLSLAVFLEPGGSGRVEDLIAWALDTSEGRATSVEIAEASLNEYLRRSASEGLLGPVQDISAELHQGDFAVQASVNLEGLATSRGSSVTALLGGLFSGPQNLKILGRLEGVSGVGRFAAKEVWLNGYSLPPSVVAYVLSSLGKKLTPPLNLTEPFQLPYGIDRIEVLPGAIRLSR